jgi:hypothetical protein
MFSPRREEIAELYGHRYANVRDRSSRKNGADFGRLQEIYLW